MKQCEDSQPTKLELSRVPKGFSEPMRSATLTVNASRSTASALLVAVRDHEETDDALNTTVDLIGTLSNVANSDAIGDGIKLLKTVSTKLGACVDIVDEASKVCFVPYVHAITKSTIANRFIQ